MNPNTSDFIFPIRLRAHQSQNSPKLLLHPQDSKQLRRITINSGRNPQQQEGVGGRAEDEGSGSHGGGQENRQPEDGRRAAQEDQRSIPSVSLALHAVI